MLCRQEGIGVAVVTALFCTRIAHVHARQGQWEACEADLACARCQAAALPARASSGPAVLLAIEIDLVDGDACRKQGQTERASVLYKQAASAASAAVAQRDHASRSADDYGDGVAASKSQIRRAKDGFQWLLAELAMRCCLQLAKCGIINGEGNPMSRIAAASSVDMCASIAHPSIFSATLCAAVLAFQASKLETIPRDHGDMTSALEQPSCMHADCYECSKSRAGAAGAPGHGRASDTAMLSRRMMLLLRAQQLCKGVPILARCKLTRSLFLQLDDHIPVCERSSYHNWCYRQ